MIAQFKLWFEYWRRWRRRRRYVKRLKGEAICCPNCFVILNDPDELITPWISSLGNIHYDCHCGTTSIWKPRAKLIKTKHGEIYE